jgi:ubiquinone/menaquinone biosynthesis C-methylase UbiE
MATGKDSTMPTTQDADAPRSKGVPFREYFSALASTYAKQTGNSTRNMFAVSLGDITAALPIMSGSRIHDNAAGPGTATSVLISSLPATLSSVEILITDDNPAMVAAAREAFPTIQVQQMDSLSLGLPDNHFSHSILNFSIFTMADPVQCLQEMRRTLQEGGVAALLTWRRFGAGEVARAAQKLVRPDLPPMAIPHEEFMTEGVLAELTVEAGFEEGDVTVSSKKVVVEGKDLDGLREFFLGDHTKPARSGWSEEEVARWPEAVDRTVQAEIAAHGGVLFESWVVLAKK